MADDRNITKDEAIKANIYVHEFLARTGEYQKSPHFRPENREKVRGILARLIARLPRKGKLRAVDFGCGTGFMIDLMKDHFAEVHGVDITPEMMKRVDVSSGNIRLHECLAERTPFEGDYFDFATAYSFMDHLFDYEDFLREAHRVLKPGGIFYADLNPNRAFIAAMDQAEHAMAGPLPPIVQREIEGALRNGAYYQKQFGLDGGLLEKAEPIKSLDKGFDAGALLAKGKGCGFSSCEIEHEWFLGQAKVMHEQSMAQSDIVNQYLCSVLPISSPLFKYLRIIFVK